MTPFTFPSVEANDPARKGQGAATSQFSFDFRYRVQPIHTRFDRIEWFVWDAARAPVFGDEPPVIRQTETLEEALAGLEGLYYEPEE